MTDKLPGRKSGGRDGDGPAETPTERLLREAMNARASLITAHDLRPAEPPNRRVRRLRPVYLTAVPIFALAASLAIGLLTFHGDPVARQDVPPPAATLSTSPSPTAEPTATPTPTPPPAATPTDTGTPSAPSQTEVPLADNTPTPSGPPSSPPTSSVATPYTFRGVRFKVPAGWSVVPPKSTDDRVCILSPGASAGAQGDWTPQACEPYGVWIVAYNTADEVKNALWPTMNDLDSDGGWSRQADCPVWGHPYVPTGPYAKVGTPVRTRDIVAGRPIAKTQWQVTCKPGDDFTGQMWGLKDDQVFIVANGLKSDYQAGLVSILDTLDLSGRQAPLTSSNGNDVAITLDGLGVGQQVSAKGTPVAFSVTYKNTSQTSYALVQPLVYTEAYAGTPQNQTIPMNAGKLERQDGDAWVPLPLSPGGGTDYAMQGKAASFPLAPGTSRTVKYRMALDAADGAGVMPVTARATLPYDGTTSLTVIGEKSVPVRVVK
ncbi:hypothetical protein P3T27_000203 [Kitasatospora sp. MAA19]|uniref:hypothetical protein n=1 Tax=Kitasatospora sp. MAA19 TaxID=3035090 RepID=UPI0024770A46|nr:hypothetical protein [Kitasatospora sp. MAA19]MDH6703522.1 hypothetical protein [Kitasatospora sp. MAA19]